VLKDIEDLCDHRIEFFIVLQYFIYAQLFDFGRRITHLTAKELTSCLVIDNEFQVVRIEEGDLSIHLGIIRGVG
jgi:hypothetical protein